MADLSTFNDGDRLSLVTPGDWTLDVNGLWYKSGAKAQAIRQTGRSLQADTLAAAIAMPGKLDSDIITTAVREEAGDNGGASYIYRVAGREAITDDGWRYINGNGDSDYLERTSISGEIDIREWGSIPASGDISTLFQNVITNCSEYSAIRVPGGPDSGYEIANLVFPNNKVMSVFGTGAKLSAAAGATHMLDIGQDTRRNAPLTIKNLEFHGNSLSVTGLKTSGRTNISLENLAVKYCLTAGIDLELAYNTDINNCVVERNYAGIKVRQTAAGGGGNANSFHNTEIYLNTIGLILDGTDSGYPQENNNFFGGTIQSNTLCGVAAFSTGNLIFHGTHFEANGSAGSTATVDGNIIRRSSIHANAAGLRLNNCSPGSDNPFIITEAGSTIHLDGLHTYGVTGELVQDYDNSSNVLMSGRIVGRGAILAKVDSPADRIDWQARFAYVTDPTLVPSQIPTNSATTADQPEPYDTSGATRETNPTDPIHGEVTSVTLAASVGSSGGNRVILEPGLGTFTAGEHALITLLVKTDKDTKIQFDLTAGSYTGIAYGFRDREWQKVVLLATAATTNTPNLYIYPLDSEGANIQFAKMQAVKVDAGDKSKIHHILNNNLYNNKKNPFEDSIRNKDVVAYSSTPSFDFDSGTGGNKEITLEGDITPVMVMDGSGYASLIVNQDSSGYHKINWPSNVAFSEAPQQPSEVPGSKTLIRFYHDGTNFCGTEKVEPDANYALHFTGTGKYGTMPSITFPDAGTIMMRVKHDSTDLTNTTRLLDFPKTGAVDTHYPFTDGKAYFNLLRTSTRVEELVLNAAIVRTDWHWIVIRTDAVDGWQALQVEDGGHWLYPIGTATHETIGTVASGTLNHESITSQLHVDRMIMFGSRLTTSQITDVCKTPPTGTLPVTPLARWELNYDVGLTKLRDQSGNGKDITLVGTDLTDFVRYNTGFSRSEGVEDVTYSSTTVINFSAGQRKSKKLTLTGDATLVFRAIEPGEYSLIISQDGTGSHVVAFPTKNMVGVPAAPASGGFESTLYRFNYDGFVFRF